MSFTANLPHKASIVILTGAGISAESGLETFRGAGGLWCGHKVEDVATPQAFARNPELVHEFYNMRRRGLLDPEIKPNPAHEALVRLETEWPGNVLVVTQNIDDLHERAGSKNLLHMHGEALKAFCHFCHHKTECRDDLSTAHTCAACKKTGGVRPDIVWFGEMPYHMEEIYAALGDCDLFLSIGTSGNVYPAAGFVAEALRHGAVTAELNLEPSLHSSVFHESITGPAGTIVPEFVNRLLKGML
ncbi:MAG: NAD-dependent protein deacylase [Alphaproteobacteria bacterium]|nr:NAD-dependent protein deacylase [Alphaproteobacteria bacterium]